MAKILDLLRVPSVGDIGTRARFKTVQSANPAANTEFTITVPAGKYYKLISVNGTLVQGATDTPRPYLQLKDASGNIIAKLPGASAAQSASVTSNYTWAADLTLSAAAALTVNGAPLPEDLILGPGYTITSDTVGKGANSDWGIVTALVVEFSRP